MSCASSFSSFSFDSRLLSRPKRPKTAGEALSFGLQVNTFIQFVQHVSWNQYASGVNRVKEFCCLLRFFGDDPGKCHIIVGEHTISAGRVNRNRQKRDEYRW